MILSDARHLFARLEEDLGLVSEISVPFKKKNAFLRRCHRIRCLTRFLLLCLKKKKRIIMASMATLPSQAHPPSD